MTKYGFSIFTILLEKKSVGLQTTRHSQFPKTSDLQTNMCQFASCRLAGEGGNQLVSCFVKVT